ncbi:hypothetical protein KJ612_19270 [Myxococcota bacterium]|nr:hypothetical protein [Myxococcota bacterium]MBU1413911.1 hypothetical protein [Myxococcota bacterium]
MKRITRKELYTQVWEIPMTKLAADYGLSDVGLAKICKKHDIPRPPRGYWVKTQSGKKSLKTPLPRRLSNDVIEIHANLGLEDKPDTRQDAREYEEVLAGPPILVAKALRNPHPLIQKAARVLETSKADENGLLKRRKNCLDVQVSDKSLRRALRIMDALVQGMVLRGFEVFLEEHGTWVHVMGEYLRFGIKEELDSKKVESKKEDLKGYYRFGHSRFESVRVPSGRLCLTILGIRDYSVHAIRQNWHDTATKTLEGQLDGFMRGLVNLIIKKKSHQRKKEERERRQQEWHDQQEEKTRRLLEIREQLETERQRITDLNNDAANLHKSKLIRELINAVEQKHTSSEQVYEPAIDLAAWKKWAHEQANRLDPLTPSPPSILDIETELEEEEKAVQESRNPFSRWSF